MEDYGGLTENVQHPLLATDLVARASHLAYLPDARRIIDKICSAHVRSIAIVSQFPGEGKTLVAATLAIAISRLTGGRVLLVDAALATRPGHYPDAQAHQALPYRELTEGVSVVFAACVSGHSPAAPSCPPSSDPDLSRLLTGVSDFDLLNFISKSKADFKIVLIDTCAFTTMSRNTFHPAVIARRVEGTLVVTSPDGMKRTALTNLKQLLERETIRPIGFIVNREE
jgi:Mrp family chromosome partitioning ATPase